MNFKKLLFTAAAVFLNLTFVLSAQMTVDPTHSFYEDCQKWQIKGYVKVVPPVRPYPYKNIKSILEDVIENGSESDAAIAKDYFEELTGKAWYLELDTEADIKNDTLGLRFHPIVKGDASFFNDMVGLGYKAGWDLRNHKDESEVSPMYSFPKYDSIQDPATIGPFSEYLDADTNISVGTEYLFAQAGLNRNGYGAFIGSNLGKNEASYHSGNLVVTYMNDFLTYSQMMSTIGASGNYNEKSLAPDKYFAMHLFELRPVKNLSVAYYENMIFGKRFDPIYLIPAPYMACQGLNGCMDNLQMGFNVNYTFMDQFLFKVDVMVDDIDFNNAVKLNFDSKNRVAGQMGLQYVSPLPFLDSVELDYTAITPYTYSHWEDLESYEEFNSKTYNYQNYTNSGINLGSQYDPNSDVISLKADFTPVKNLKINTGFDFARHGNISESVTDSEAFEYLCADPEVYRTDGTLLVNSKVNKHKVYSAWNSLNFLNQDHIMYLIRPSISATYRLPTFFGKLKTSIGMSYTYEFIHNYGVNTNLYPGGDITNITYTTDADGNTVIDTFEWQGETKAYTDENVATVVDYYKDLWASNLFDKQNHIFSIYFTVIW